MPIELSDNMEDFRKVLDLLLQKHEQLRQNEIEIFTTGGSFRGVLEKRTGELVHLRDINVDRWSVIQGDKVGSQLERNHIISLRTITAVSFISYVPTAGK